MTTPNLPPYPKPDIIDGEPYWFDRHMDAYALEACQAGRDAGLEDAAKIMRTFEGSECSGMAREAIERIRKLKSAAKGGI